jgi:single-stranded DNA-binding protein
MNLMTLGGTVCTLPKIKLLNIGNEYSVGMCVFSVATISENDKGESISDFFECVAFGDVAKFIYKNFVQGAKIICSGTMRNHFWNDSNDTKHFTNVMVISHAEFGDTDSVFHKYNGKKKSIALSIDADINEIYRLYQGVCEKGFLCIDEDDYYKIAMANI